MLTVLLFLSAGWLVFSCLAVVGSVGKPRERITPAVAVVTLIVTIPIIITIVAAALALAN